MMLELSLIMVVMIIVGDRVSVRESRRTELDQLSSLELVITASGGEGLILIWEEAEGRALET